MVFFFLFSDFLSSAASTIAVVAGLGVVTGGLGPGAAVADQLGDLDGGSPTPMGAIKVTEGEPLSEEAARIQRKLAAQVRLQQHFVGLEYRDPNASCWKDVQA